MRTALIIGRDYGLINWVLGLFGLDHIERQAGTWSSWIALSLIVTAVFAVMGRQIIDGIMQGAVKG